MRVVIVTVQVPFVRGGAEILAEGLRAALEAAGHQTEIVAIPSRWRPPESLLDCMLACRLLDLSDITSVTIDCAIVLKFPAYLVRHPNKVVWLLHQHRAAYDLWDNGVGELVHSPNGAHVREAIRQADRRFIGEARGVFTISRNVSRRLQAYSGIGSTHLYPPVSDADRYVAAEPERYLFFPSRLSFMKRQSLVLEALARTRHPVHVRFAGVGDSPAESDALIRLARVLGVERRVEWLGWVSDAEKRRQYAQALGVVFPPLDEDYGYVALEAMLAARPLITCSDSGGPLEFVRHGETGLVADPTPESLGAAMDALWEDPGQAMGWGRAGRQGYDGLDLTWPSVVRRLLACA
jgi:glycosyltransferase involved in cell wall biosynthesis